MIKLYRTIPIKAKFTDEEKAYHLDQCQNANSLINCAIYHTRQTHYQWREEQSNAFSVYWRGDELRCGWKLYKCRTTYPELDKALKLNPHYKALAAQAAQQTLKSVGESIKSYNSLVDAYYQGEVNRPSKRGNQNFMPIPTGRLIERLKQLCTEYGIVLTLTEEAYTSQASFLDGDSLPKHGEKPQRWTPSGKRVKRGLYKASGNQLVNADCNGAGNILRKVATQLGLNLAKVGRGSLTLPKRYDLFSKLKRSYREKCEATVFQAVA